MILGITIEPGHDCTCSTEEEVHLSLASIESRSYCGGAGSYSQLMLKTASSEQLLCTFIHGVIFQQCLDLKLMPGEKVTFTVQGSYRIYITGYSNGSCGHPLLPGCEQEDTEGRNDDNIVVKPEADNTENFNGDGRDVEMSNDIEVLQEGQQDIVVKSEPDDGEDFNGESRDDEISNDNEVLQERQQGESCPQIKSEPEDYDDLNNGSWNEEMTEPNSRLSEGLNGRLEGEDYLVSQESVTSKERNRHEVEEAHAGGPDVLAEEGHVFHQMHLGEAIVTDIAVEGSIDNNPSAMPGRSIIETAALFAHGTSKQDNVMNDMVEDNIDRNYDVPLLPEDDSSGVTGADGGNLFNMENSSVESNSQEQSNVCSRSKKDISDTEPGEPLKVNEMNKTAPPHETEHSKSTSGLGHGNILEIQGKKKQVPATKNLKVFLCEDSGVSGESATSEGKNGHDVEEGCTVGPDVLAEDGDGLDQTHWDAANVAEIEVEGSIDVTTVDANQSAMHAGSIETAALFAHGTSKQDKVMNDMVEDNIDSNKSVVPLLQEGDMAGVTEADGGNLFNTENSSVESNSQEQSNVCSRSNTDISDAESGEPLKVNEMNKTAPPHDTLDDRSTSGFGRGKILETQGRNKQVTATKSLIKVFLCRYCVKSFDCKVDLKLHEYSHSNEAIFSCKQCKKVFLNRESLVTHEKIHQEEETFVCEECQEKFCSLSKLLEHKKSHFRHTNPYHCNICEKKFVNWVALHVHARVHKRIKASKNLLQCGHCENIFSTVKDLSLHKKVHTGAAKRKQFKHSYYVERFQRQRDMVAHEWTHTSGKQYQCNRCEKRFNTSSDLQSHKKIIHSRKMFKCFYCGKSFRHKVTLVHHERIHTKVTPYNCKFCKKKFYAKSSLNLHESLHSEAKPFPCKHCDKAFSTTNLLIKHETIHNVMKQY